MCLSSKPAPVSRPDPKVQEDANRAAAQARVEAEAAKRKEIEKLAQAKREDIDEALDSRTAREGGSGGGKGRRSLFTSESGGAGYLSRFG